MPDRENVIRAVDIFFDYWLEQHGCLHPLAMENVRQLKADALAMLKEQEAVEPITDSARNRRCPKCNMILKGKFCHECGQEVKCNA